MFSPDAVLSVTFVDAVPAPVAGPLVSRRAPARVGATDRLMTVAPIRGLAAVPVSGHVFDMMSHAHIPTTSVPALQPGDV